MHQIEIVNIDRNQILDEPHPPPSSSDPSLNTIQITFYCGAQRNIPLDVYNKIEFLRQPIIYRSVKLFDLYILPTLMNYKFNLNENDINLSSYIDETKIYNIAPSVNQMMDLSVCSGLHTYSEKAPNFSSGMNSNYYG